MKGTILDAPFSVVEQMEIIDFPNPSSVLAAPSIKSTWPPNPEFAYFDEVISSHPKNILDNIAIIVIILNMYYILLAHTMDHYVNITHFYRMTKVSLN